MKNVIIYEGNAFLDRYKRLIDFIGAGDRISVTSDLPTFLRKAESSQIAIVSDFGDSGVEDKNEMYKIALQLNNVNPNIITLAYLAKIENQNDQELISYFDGHITTINGILFSQEHYEEFLPRFFPQHFDKTEFDDFFPFLFLQIALRASHKTDLLEALSTLRSLYEHKTATATEQ